MEHAAAELIGDLQGAVDRFLRHIVGSLGALAELMRAFQMLCQFLLEPLEEAPSDVT